MTQINNKSLQSVINELNLTPDLIQSDLELNVSFGCIKNSEGSPVSYGSGNGENHNDKFIGECIEHLFYNAHSKTVSKTISEIKEQSEFSKDNILSNIPNDYMNNKIEAVPFHSLYDEKKIVFIPSEWCFHSSTSSKIIPPELHTSSGFSFGFNLELAISHGLLELIERHLISQLFYCLDNDFTPNATKICLNSHIDYINNLETKFQGKIFVFNIHSKIGIPTILCVFYPSDSNKRIILPQTSSKSFFNIDKAFTGAINELTQILVLYSDEEQEEDLKIIKNKNLISNYKKSLFLDTLTLLHANVVPSLPTQSTYDLMSLVKIFESLGYAPCYRKVKEFNNSSCVTQVFMPGVDKYNLIRLGHIVPINGNFGEI